MKMLETQRSAEIARARLNAYSEAVNEKVYDPLQYQEWKPPFKMLIERIGIPPEEKVFYRKKHVGDQVHKALEGFFYSKSSSA